MVAVTGFVVEIGFEGLHLALGFLHLVCYFFVVEAGAGYLLFLMGTKI